MLAVMPGTCQGGASGCDHKRWTFKSHFERKLPQSVRNGLVGTPLNIKAPTPYLAKADELMASTKATQRAGGAVNEVGGDKAKEGDDDDVNAIGGRAGRVGGRGGSGRGGRGRTGGGGRGGGNGTRPYNVCTNHHRFGKDTWVCNGQAFCKFKDQVVPKPDNKKKD